MAGPTIRPAAKARRAVFQQSAHKARSTGGSKAGMTSESCQPSCSIHDSDEHLVHHPTIHNASSKAKGTTQGLLYQNQAYTDHITSSTNGITENLDNAKSKETATSGRMSTCPLKQEPGSQDHSLNLAGSCINKVCTEKQAGPISIKLRFQGKDVVSESKPSNGYLTAYKVLKQENDDTLVQTAAEVDAITQFKPKHKSRLYKCVDLAELGQNSQDSNSTGQDSARVRANVEIMRRSIAVTPGPDPGAILNRIFGIEARGTIDSSDDSLFVENSASNFTSLQDDDDSNGEKDGKMTSQLAWNAFQELQTGFESLSKAGKVSYEDQLHWSIMKEDYIRDFKKRRLDKAVAKEELRTAKTLTELRQDRRAVITRINEDRQLSVRQDIESSRRPKKRECESESLAEEASHKKPKRPGQSTYSISAWLPGFNPGLRGSIEFDYDPDMRRSLTPEESQDSDEDDEVTFDPRREASLSETSLQALDHESNSILEPHFESENSSRALTRIVTHVLESGPEAKRRLNDDKKTVIDAKKHFRRGNKPTLIPNTTDRYKVPRMRSALRAYQIVGVGWMRWRELSADEPRGGLLCDGMGLGKTVQCLGLITDGQPDKSAIKDGQQGTLVVCPATLLDQWEEEVFKHCEKKWIGKVTRYKSKDFARTTSDPLEQLKGFNIIITTYEEVIISYPFEDYPVGKKTKAERQAWWESHFERRAGLLHRIHFHRFIIDECHRVKNCNSKAYEAIRAIKATHRWLVSGTPVMDQPTELFSYFKIMHKQFTGNLQTFRKNYLHPLDVDHEHRLNYSLHNFVYGRKSKDIFLGKPILELPPAKEVQIMCTLSKFENAVYQEIVRRYSDLIERADSDKKQKFEHIFHMMNALQQLNSHPLLVQKEFSLMSETKLDELQAIYEEEARCNYKDNLSFLQRAHNIDEKAGLGARYGKLPDFKIYRDALAKDKEGSQSVLPCSWCKRIPAITQVVPCDHVLCENCTRELHTDLNGQGATCDASSCGIPVLELKDLDERTIAGMVDHTASKVDDGGEGHGVKQRKGKKKNKKGVDNKDPDLTGSWLKISGVPMPSSKMIAVKLKLLEWISKDAKVKIIIFTHYLSMIYSLKRLCEVEGWDYIEFSGNVPAPQRTANRKEFTIRSGPCVLLATIKTGNVGLNITAATRVIIIEPWWNRGIDQQAFARVHRMGQQKPTECVRLLMQGTIDDRKVRIAKDKTAHIMKLAMNGKFNNLSVEALIRLFKPAETKAEKKAGGFILDDDTKVLTTVLDEDNDESDTSTDDSNSTSSDMEDDDSDDSDFDDMAPILSQRRKLRR